MSDPWNAMRRPSVQRLLSTLAVVAATYGPAQANADCFDRLLASLTTPTDVSACKLLSLTDGRIIAVRTEHGLFVQSASGPTSTHYFLDAKHHRIDEQIFARRHAYPPMDRPEPDAKQYYYPFYGPMRPSPMSGSPKITTFVCQSSVAFLATSDAPCPR